MPESITLNADTPASRFLAVAISKGGKARDMKGVLLAKVSLTLNGVELPFEAVVNQMSEEYAGMIDHKAREAALDMLTDAGLGEAVTRLAQARQHLRGVISTLDLKVPDPDLPLVEPA